MVLYVVCVLCVFGTFHQSMSQVVEMKPKNFEFTKMVVNLALSDGNHLGTAWYSVLQCISQARRFPCYSLVLCSLLVVSSLSDLFRNLNPPPTANASAGVPPSPCDRIFPCVLVWAVRQAAGDGVGRQGRRGVLPVQLRPSVL
jgi:hypothetical protein